MIDEKKTQEIHKQIINNIYSMLPEGAHQGRLQNGTFKIECSWLKGELTKLSIDGRETPAKDAQENWDCILKHVGFIVPKFTGKRTLTVTLEGCEVVKVWMDMGKNIIYKRREDQFNKFPARTI
jgi:hypothetical protein